MRTTSRPGTACTLAMIGCGVMLALAGCASTSVKDLPLAPADSGALAGVRAQLRSDDEPFVLLVRFTLKDTPEAETEFVKLAGEAHAGTIREPGQLAYRFSRSAGNPRQVMLYEEWRSFEHLRHHFTHGYVTNLIGRMGALTEGSPELVVYRPMHPWGK